MSRAQGINTNFNIVLGLAVSNALVALSGALLSQYQGFADVGMGRGAIVIGLAAVIIGEAVFGRIFHNFALKMMSVSLGAIIYYIVIQLVLTLGFDANLLKSHRRYLQCSRCLRASFPVGESAEYHHGGDGLRRWPTLPRTAMTSQLS